MSKVVCNVYIQWNSLTGWKYKVPDDGLSEAQKNSYITWDNIDLPKFHKCKRTERKCLFCYDPKKTQMTGFMHIKATVDNSTAKKKKKISNFFRFKGRAASNVNRY